MKNIKIKNKLLGLDCPIFISAEIGVTCNGDISLTKELIDAAKMAGADAVKLIFWFPEEIMKKNNKIYNYEIIKNNKKVFVKENMFEMLTKLKFSLEDWFQIKEYANKKKIILFSTVNSPSGLNYAKKLKLDAYKMSSWDFNYIPLWQEIKKVCKPIIIDTGPVFKSELSKVLSILKKNKKNEILLVHCFHTEKLNEMNMLTIPYLRSKYNCNVGFSPSGKDIKQDIVATSLGAVYLEKRLTISRNLPGHHHILSLEPKEFFNYVKEIKNIKETLGHKDLIPSKADLEDRKLFFRHIAAKKKIKKGDILNKDLITFLRPEKGVSPIFLNKFLGKRVLYNINAGDPIRFKDIGLK